MLRYLLHAKEAMKRIAKDRSAKMSVCGKAGTKNKDEQHVETQMLETQEDQKETQNIVKTRVTRSTAVKNESSEIQKAGCSSEIKQDSKVIKEENILENEKLQDDQPQNDGKSSKIDLSLFQFKPEKKAVLASISPKKRQQIKIEYEQTSPPKMIKQESEDEDNPKKDLATKTEDGMPLHWEAVLNNLREMRKNRDAPVDSMGCHKCPDENESPKVSC